MKLAEMYYEEAVRPILDSNFPGMCYSAGLMGGGSEVLGYDTEMSMDHNWGPRLLLFISDEDFKTSSMEIDSVLRKALPHEFHGFSTSFGAPDGIGVRLQVEKKDGEVEHYIRITRVGDFFSNYLGMDCGNKIGTLDWLTFSEQKLFSIARGRLFRDELGVTQIVDRLHYYPEEVWRYILASQWIRISQIEPFVGRASDVGDGLGSRIIASAIVKELMRLSFLLEKKYAPYSKWFGSAFSELKISGVLKPLLDGIISADSKEKRETLLTSAYEVLAEKHNSLRITPALATGVTKFHNRPYLVIHGERFADAIMETISDVEIKRLKPLGSVNQFMDSTDAIEDLEVMKIAKVLYR